MPRTCSYLTSGKFENELAERAPHNRENDLKIIIGVNVFSVSLRSLWIDHFYHMALFSTDNNYVLPRKNFVKTTSTPVPRATPSPPLDTQNDREAQWEEDAIFKE